MCVPEIVHLCPDDVLIKDEPNDAASDSTDPDRLEVDMDVDEDTSQTGSNFKQEREDEYIVYKGADDDESNSTSETENTSDNQRLYLPQGPTEQLWHALNGHNAPSPVTGELLRKLITCRKLGMSITPTGQQVSFYTTNLPTKFQ